MILQYITNFIAKFRLIIRHIQSRKLQLLIIKLFNSNNNNMKNVFLRITTIIAIIVLFSNSMFGQKSHVSDNGKFNNKQATYTLNFNTPATIGSSEVVTGKLQQGRTIYYLHGTIMKKTNGSIQFVLVMYTDLGRKKQIGQLEALCTSSGNTKTFVGTSKPVVSTKPVMASISKNSVFFQLTF